MNEQWKFAAMNVLGFVTGAGMVLTVNSATLGTSLTAGIIAVIAFVTAQMVFRQW